MNRNIQKSVERGGAIIRRNERHDLNTEELRQFLDNFDKIASEKGVFDAVWSTVETAFHLGVAVGAKCENKRLKKRTQNQGDGQ